MFDAREFVRQLEPPSFVDLSGQRHVGRHLSYLEALRWAERFEGMLATPPGAALAEAELRALAEAFGLPADPLLALPGEACLAAFVDFFVSRKPAPPAASP